MGRYKILIEEYVEKTYKKATKLGQKNYLICIKPLLSFRIIRCIIILKTHKLIVKVSIGGVGMNNEMRMQINSLAEDIIKMFDISTPIHNMEDVVEKLGGKLEEDARIGSFSDGKIDREDPEVRFSIKIPYNQSESRKNFTVAHELGHLFLHMGYLIDDEMWENSKQMTFYRRGDSELEWQANEFAAAFLMPEKEYREVLDNFSEDGYVLISKVADYFNVSIDAASYRGKWLGYLEW